MTELERAEAYASIFANAGDEWERFKPDDAIVVGEAVYLRGGIRLQRVEVEGGWRITEPGRSWLVRAKERPA